MQPYKIFLRRLAALLYDSLCLAGLLIFVGFCAVSINGGKAIAPANLYFQFILVSVIAAYFILSWYWGRQTLGMRAWNLWLVDRNNPSASLSVWQCILRFLSAIVAYGCFGLGLFWALLPKQYIAWHDVISKTVLIHK